LSPCARFVKICLQDGGFLPTSVSHRVRLKPRILAIQFFT